MLLVVENRFINYLLSESISSLAILASAELGGISGGRYGLIAEQRGFMFMDHANDDETRSVDTLFGGKTFLASLGLATALALPSLAPSPDGRLGVQKCGLRCARRPA